MRNYLAAFVMASLLAGCGSIEVYDIAFIGQAPNPNHIRYMDSDGTLSDPLYLPNGEQVNLTGQTPLNWSRDGERLAFSSLINGNQDIYSIGSGGNDVRRITDHPESDVSPEYSPDGHRIVYITNRDNIHLRDIYLKELIAGTNIRLSATSSYYLSPTWHPSGVKIFYGVAQVSKVVLYSLDSTTNAVTQLADLPSNAQGFRASPDGAKIVFYTGGGATNVYVINSDGSNQQNLTQSSSFGERYQFPSWYHSDQIIYTKYGTNEGIYKMNLDGSAKTLIGLYGHAASSPVYRFKKLDDCTLFESLGSGDEYLVGSTIPSLAEFTVGNFVWSDGTTTASGKLRGDVRGYAGGSGNDVNTRNVTIVPLHTFPSDSISFKFAELGGTNNVTINGGFNQVANLIDLNGTNINGVNISVAAIQSGVNWYGVVTLNGNITDFSIGGQELWIDDYCFDTP